MTRKMSTPSSERRRAQRGRTRLQVRYWNDDGEGVGYTADVSQSGMFIQTRKTYPVGTRLHIEVSLPNGPFFAEGLVTRVLQASTTMQPVVKAGFGVRLLNLSEVLRTLRAGEDSSRPELRVDLSDPVRLNRAWQQELSRGGLFVLTEHPLERDAKVRLRIELPEPLGQLELEGTVVHVMDTPKGAAVELARPDVLRAKIAALVGAS